MVQTTSECVRWIPHQRHTIKYVVYAPKARDYMSVEYAPKRSEYVRWMPTNRRAILSVECPTIKHVTTSSDDPQRHTIISVGDPTKGTRIYPLTTHQRWANRQLTTHITTHNLCLLENPHQGHSNMPVECPIEDMQLCPFDAPLKPLLRICRSEATKDARLCRFTPPLSILVSFSFMTPRRVAIPHRWHAIGQTSRFTKYYATLIPSKY